MRGIEPGANNPLPRWHRCICWDIEMDEIDPRDMEEWKKIGDFLNARGDHEHEEVFRDLARNVLIEFSDVADYLWKTPNLIEHERAVEEEKLRDYFPLTGDFEKDDLATWLRTQRWVHGSRKLFSLFPSLMASGNLFLSLAMFESYCLKIVKLIEERSRYSLREARGRGTSRIFAFFKCQAFDILICPMRARYKSLYEFEIA
jgi:hypothetical protein